MSILGLNTSRRRQDLVDFDTESNAFLVVHTFTITRRGQLADMPYI